MRLISTLSFFLITSFANADWAPGSSSISADYAGGEGYNFSLEMDNPYSWTVQQSIFGVTASVNVLELNTTGGYDIGYRYSWAYNFGEGIDVQADGYSTPQLLTRAYMNIGAAAWLELKGPGLYFDFIGIDPIELDLLELLGVQSEINLHYESPQISAQLPFLSDGSPLVSVPFALGLYTGPNEDSEYDPTIAFNLGRFLPPGTVAKIGFSPGVNGELEFGLNQIEYKYQGSSLGSQTGVELGVDVSAFAGANVTLDNRDYHFQVQGPVQGGLALFAELGYLGFTVATYYPLVGSDPPHVIEATVPVSVAVPPITASVEYSYLIPSMANPVVPEEPVPLGGGAIGDSSGPVIGAISGNVDQLLAGTEISISALVSDQSAIDSIVLVIRDQSQNVVGQSDMQQISAGRFGAVIDTSGYSLGNYVASIEATDSMSISSVENVFEFEVVVVLTSIQDTDGDGIGDDIDTDIDGDGLSNIEERLMGLDPFLVDSDGDGVADSDEVTLVSGTISVDTVWSKANSPYKLSSHVTVANRCIEDEDGCTGVYEPTILQIDPGVFVDLNARNLTVAGGVLDVDGATLINTGSATSTVIGIEGCSDGCPDALIDFDDVLVVDNKRIDVDLYGGESGSNRLEFDGVTWNESGTAFDFLQGSEVEILSSTIDGRLRLYTADVSLSGNTIVQNGYEIGGTYVEDHNLSVLDGVSEYRLVDHLTVADYCVPDTFGSCVGNYVRSVFSVSPGVVLDLNGFNLTVAGGVLDVDGATLINTGSATSTVIGIEGCSDGCPDALIDFDDVLVVDNKRIDVDLYGGESGSNRLEFDGVTWNESGTAFDFLQGSEVEILSSTIDGRLRLYTADVSLSGNTIVQNGYEIGGTYVEDHNLSVLDGVSEYRLVDHLTVADYCVPDTFGSCVGNYVRSVFSVSPGVVLDLNGFNLTVAGGVLDVDGATLINTGSATSTVIGIEGCSDGCPDALIDFDDVLVVDNKRIDVDLYGGESGSNRLEFDGVTWNESGTAFDFLQGSEVEILSSTIDGRLRLYTADVSLSGNTIVQNGYEIGGTYVEDHNLSVLDGVSEYRLVDHLTVADYCVPDTFGSCVGNYVRSVFSVSPGVVLDLNGFNLTVAGGVLDVDGATLINTGSATSTVIGIEGCSDGCPDALIDFDDVLVVDNKRIDVDLYGGESGSNRLEFDGVTWNESGTAFDFLQGSEVEILSSTIDGRLRLYTADVSLSGNTIVQNGYEIGGTYVEDHNLSVLDGVSEYRLVDHLTVADYCVPDTFGSCVGNYVRSVFSVSPGVVLDLNGFNLTVAGGVLDVDGATLINTGSATSTVIGIEGCSDGCPGGIFDFDDVYLPDQQRINLRVYGGGSESGASRLEMSYSNWEEAQGEIRIDQGAEGYIYNTNIVPALIVESAEFYSSPVQSSDWDGDGLLNEEDSDDDNDGMNDSFEMLHNLDPYSPDDASLDADGDGLTNLEEFIGGTDPQDSNSPLPFDDVDSDGDEEPDVTDAFPNDPFEQFDTDGDGVGDNSDAFPLIAAASLDTDKDGLPEVWNDSCDQVCQEGAGLMLDTSILVDNNDLGFSTVGAWGTSTDGIGYLGADWRYKAAGDGSADATWAARFVPGPYDVFVTHTRSANRATDARFRVYHNDGAGNTVSTDVRISQQSDSRIWLGRFNFSGMGMVVLTDDADGFVIADSVRWESAAVDTDGDGIADSIDSFPNDPFEYFDSDGDGVGDNADAFPGSAAAAVDNDHDSQPDLWNADCDLTCQVGSGLTIDTALLVDNIDLGFSTTGVWNVNSSNSGFVGADWLFAASGDGTTTATWLTNMVPGDYEVFVSYTQANNRATDAAFTIYHEDDAGSTVASSVQISQRSGGSPKSLGVFTFGSSSMVELTNASDGFVIADSVRWEAATNDTDGDGTIDDVDAFPNDPFESTDGDLDGVGDNEDAFPNDASASVDTDGDGYPNVWNATCDEACQDGSSLTLDVYPADPARQFADAMIVRSVDNADVGFSTTGSWRTSSGRTGFVGADFHYPSTDRSANKASWSLGMSPGTYDLYVTYSEYTNRASNATYTVYHSDGSGGTTSTSVVVDQRSGSPTYLGAFTLDEAALVELSGVGNGVVTADSVRLVLSGIDSDADGLPDDWEQLIFGNLTTSDAVSDYDGDGVGDLDEVLAGTDPLVAPVIDADGDEVPDEEDAFPNDASASVDTDGDGYPDAWNVTCNEACQDGSSLTLDVYPADPARQFADAMIVRSVDNADVGFSTTGSWRTSSGRTGFVGADFHYPSTDTSANKASWSLATSPGTYDLYVTYSEYTNRASNATYTVYHSDGSGGTTSTSVVVDQRSGSPTYLGAFTLDEAALVELSGVGNGVVTADSVRLVLSGIDSDADGLPDVWEQLIFGNLTTSDAVSDYDGDGVGDLDEVVAGTDPLVVPVIDADGDEVPDEEDAFPNDASASVDTDGDGYPDAWNVTCNEACQDGSSLTLDVYPADPARQFADAMIVRSVDNADVGFSTTGSWRTSSGRTGFVGADFHYPSTDTSANKASWSLATSPGTYDLYVTYSEYTNRASNATYTVYHSDGSGGTTSTSVVVDQRSGSPTYLGAFTLDEAGLVELSGVGNGVVTADSVRLVLSGIDSDADGLPDDWEQSVFGNLTTSDAVSDYDGDGVGDLDEVLAGTDPLIGHVTVIVDNVDTGFSTAGTWGTSSGRTGFVGADFRYASTGTGANEASWSANLALSSYDVYVTFSEYSNRASDASYMIYHADGSGGTIGTSVVVDQRSGSPTYLGAFNFDGSALVELTDAGDGVITADTVKWVPN